MESPGEYLKREREVRGTSLSSIATATRIQLKYLQALEADAYDQLPHPTFVKGFIKNYCKELGLDEVDAVLRFELYMREKAEKADAAPAVPRQRPMLSAQEPLKKLKMSIRPTNNLIITGLAIIGVVIIVIVYFVNRGPRHAPTPLDQAQNAPMPVMQVVPEPIKSEPAPPAPSVAPGTSAQPLPQPGMVVPTAGAPTAGAPSAGPGVAQEHTLVLNAREISWIKIRIDGKEPFDVILREGESASWKGRTFSLLVGNAGGVGLSFDGRKTGQLGKGGEVVRLTLPQSTPVIQAEPAR